MAQQSQPQYKFHYQWVQLLKTEELGVGSYGAVCQAMCVTCPVLLKFSTQPSFSSLPLELQVLCESLSKIVIFWVP